MEEEQTKGRSTRKRRSTGSRGSLKRFTTVDSVTVEEPFSFSLPKDAAQLAQSFSDPGKNENSDPLKAGDACYVSATVQNRRYYGVLVDQATLRAASLLYFHDEASSLDLNRRMKMLAGQKAVEEKTPDEVLSHEEGTSIKREAPQSKDENDSKRQKLDTTQQAEHDSRPVQKFRYIEKHKHTGSSSDPGYRILLATYADVIAASEDDPEKADLIEKACVSGGDFVGNFYYQFEVVASSLVFSKTEKRSDIGFHTSMGFQSFLHNTNLPTWFPLSNLESGQHKVLSILNMKKNSKGGIEWDTNAASKTAAANEPFQGTALPMEPRTCFRIGVVGAGIAGLATALELLQQSEKEKVDLEVTLLEGRSRIGGRIFTDETTFKSADGAPIPVDLGASWIHGIEHNPLATLAKEAGVDFVTTSEDVKMFRSRMGGVDVDVDENMGKLFDDLLDQAADDCWNKEDYAPNMLRSQNAVRWYASVLAPQSEESGPAVVRKRPMETDAPYHRFSSDVSVDHAIGNAISKSKKREFSKLSSVENSLLLWNTKNIEYALGANISDLSMKYWDADDRHAFEGDHVLLKQGYSKVVQHLMRKLEKYGGKFKCFLEFAIGKIEYARKSQSLPYRDRYRRSRKAIDLSDKCCITSQDGSRQHYFDFVVSALPLGVLKESVCEQKEDSCSLARVDFEPPLPPSKVDVIQNVGFGLLNKVYLQFPVAFWRLAGALDNDQILFGNVSGLNPHHYMFFDVGKGLHVNEEAPAILMTLISGKEATDSEFMSDAELVDDVMRTLRCIFSNTEVPEPTASKTTRWGSDAFSRGCYTFLPPGATEQDFQILQSPVNGNGDSLLLDSNETMRLFWAGEHTTALHPSMSHGALLSGIRAAREVMAAMHVDVTEYGCDRLIPLPLFRSINPETPLQCSLCLQVGSGAREGPLLAFQRGSRQVLVHGSCGENSPEVEVKDGKWKHVIKAVNRGKQIKCSMCGSFGATVGCTHETCFRSFHFSCSEDTGWNFQKDGKVFYCDLHRSRSSLRSSLRLDLSSKHGSECNRISIAFFRSKNPMAVIQCAFCGELGDDDKRGKLLAFQRNRRQMLGHANCVRCTNLIETLVDSDGDGEQEYKNVFEALSLSTQCAKCGRIGATVRCSDTFCDRVYHLLCANGTENTWKNREQFICDQHREQAEPASTEQSTNSSDSEGKSPFGGLFQHALLFQGARSHVDENVGGGSVSTSVSLPSNARTDTGQVSMRMMEASAHDRNNSNGSDEDECREVESSNDIMACRLSYDNALTGRGMETVQMRRTSLQQPWGLCFTLGQGDSAEETHLLVSVGPNGDLPRGFQDGDRIAAVDGKTLGSDQLFCLRDVLAAMGRKLHVAVEVARDPVEHVI